MSMLLLGDKHWVLLAVTSDVRKWQRLEGHFRHEKDKVKEGHDEVA